MNILLVEDFDSLREATCDGLEKAGHHVHAAADGDEAMHLLNQHSYDIAILDWMLPGHSGIALLQAIRRKKSKTQVMMLTAKTSTPDKVKGFECGADDYLCKPFSFLELLARVRKLARHRHGLRSSTLVLGELAVDTHQQTVHYAAQPLSLTDREYAIFELLAVNEGQLVSLDQICQQVYGMDVLPGSNVLSVHVLALRRKMAAVTDAVTIEAKRGFGYRLRCAINS